jgi:hypothetical protein
MSGEGPTVAGSIVGKLKVDDSEWVAELDRAEVKARELGASNPEIKVKAAVTDALAKMEAVKAAEEQLGFANDRLKISYQKLDEVQTKGGASESRLMSLHLASARAEAAHEAATRKLADAQRVLNDANAVGSGVHDTAAPAAAPPKGGGAAAGPAVAIGIAIAALLPLVSALAGTVAALGGAFAGMGAAGVLAVLGIKHAMADGTAAGNQFSAGLEILRGNLNQLENSAATAMLVSFQRAISLINDSMGPLNAEIGSFSHVLGTAGTIALSTLISGFQILNPLFLQAGMFIEQLAVGWQKWTNGGGLAKFAQDASVALPRVTDALGSLLNGALSLIGAFAPLGTVILGVVGIAGQLLTVLAPLIANLLPIAAAAGAVWGAFALWKLIEPVVGKATLAVKTFGVGLSIVGGIAGMAVAAVGYIASAFVASRIASMDAASALQDYTAAVEQDNGVIGESVRKQTAKALADKNSLGQYNSLGQSAIDIGRKLGITAETTTQATLGNHAAILKVNKAMTDYANNPANSTAKVAAFRANWINLTGVISDNQKKTGDAIKAYNDVASAQGLATISTKAQLDAQIALASGYGMSVSAYLQVVASFQAGAPAMAAALGMTQGAYVALAVAESSATQAAKDWKSETDLLNGVPQTLEAANIKVAADFITLAANIQTSMKTMGAAQATSLDINTATGNANHQWVLTAVQDAQAQADAVVASETKQGIAVTTAKADGDAALAKNRQSIIDHATQAGLDAGQVSGLVDQILRLPKDKTVKLEADATQAMMTVAQLQAALDRLTANSQIVANQYAAGNVYTTYKHADGGTIGMAGGGSVQGPGGPKSDSVPAWLSTGEEVIQNPWSSRFRPVLKALNVGDAATARAELGGGSRSVVNNYYITESNNGVATAQMVTHYQSMQGV